MPLPLIAGAAVVGGGLAGLFASMSAAERAAALQDKQLQELLKISLPNVEDQKIALEEFVMTGELSPEMETAFSQAPSAMEQITEQGPGREAQLNALRNLEQAGFGGLSLGDKAAMQEAEQSSMRQEKGSREAIKQGFARQGQGGSGFELQAQLAAQQSGADRNAQSGLSMAAQAQDRALKAIMQAGQLGGDMRGQEYGMAKDKASAQDSISRFNTANMQDVGARNIAAKNNAQRANLAMKQEIADRNVQGRNQSQMHNKGLGQQAFENQMSMARAKGGVYGNQAAGEIAKGAAQSNAFNSIGQGVGNMAMYQPKTAQKQVDSNTLSVNDDDDWYKKNKWVS